MTKNLIRIQNSLTLRQKNALDEIHRRTHFLLRLIIFDKTKLCLFCLVSEDVTNRIFTSRLTEVGAIGNRRVGRYSACDTAYV